METADRRRKKEQCLIDTRYEYIVLAASQYHMKVPVPYSRHADRDGSVRRVVRVTNFLFYSNKQNVCCC